MPISSKKKTSSSAASVATSQKEKKMFPTEKLLKSKHLEKYQPDFARVILTKPAYTISEAIEALDEVLKGGD